MHLDITRDMTIEDMMTGEMIEEDMITGVMMEGDMITGEMIEKDIRGRRIKRVMTAKIGNIRYHR